MVERSSEGNRFHRTCAVLVVVGNKADLEKFRKVSKAAAEEYARSIGALGYVEASAKVLLTP